MVAIGDCSGGRHDQSVTFTLCQMPHIMDMLLHEVPEQSTMFCALRETSPPPDREEAPSRAPMAANAYEQLHRSCQCRRVTQQV